MRPSGAARPHILLVNRVFPPAEGATGEHLSELAAYLVGRGWAATVLAGPAPDAPSDTTTPAGVRVVRVRPLFHPEGRGGGKPGLAARAAGFLALHPVLLARALRLPRPDVIVTKTDPPLLAVLGPLIARRRRVRLVHWAQDLYPEIAEALGVIAPGRAARLLRRLSTVALRRYDRVVAIGSCMRGRLEARGLPPHRIVEIPNWALEGGEPMSPDESTVRPEIGGDGKFVVMYSGNMGLAHPFDAMLDAAEQLRERAPDVRFALVGSGARREWLAREVERRGLANVGLYPFQPKERLAESLSAADLHLVSMEAAALGLVVPSKIYGVAAVGRPCVFLGPAASEAALFLETNDAGTVLETPDGESLSRVILAWRDDPARRLAAGQRAREAAEAGRASSLRSWESLLREVVGSPHVPA